MSDTVIGTRLMGPSRWERETRQNGDPVQPRHVTEIGYPTIRLKFFREATVRLAFVERRGDVPEIA